MAERDTDMASSSGAAPMGPQTEEEAAGMTEQQVKDAEALLQSMERYHPILPEAVTEYYMGLSGYQSTDPRITRLASLAAHKFVADITNDALRVAKQRNQGKGRLVLTTEDLAITAREYGITIRKPGYYADVPAQGDGAP